MEKYLEKIKGTILIKPNPDERTVYFMKEDNGEFRDYITISPRGYINLSNSCSWAITNLLGKNVIFMPIKTKNEAETLEERIKENNGCIVFECDVYKKDESSGRVLESRIKAEVYNPLKTNSAKRIKKFMVRYVYGKKR